MNLPLPQRPSGAPNEQVRQLFTYIFQFVEQLNYQLQQMEDNKTATDANITSLQSQIQGIEEKIGQFISDEQEG